MREYRTTGDRSIRNRIVEENLHLADYHVRRFSHSKGVSVEDLRQVAFIAIIHAVERFDPDRGVSLRTFASRTIDGELKRHLRDGAWAVRPPRRLQELHLNIRMIAEEMTHELGRTVTVVELANRMGVSQESVLEGLDVARARTATYVDNPDDAEGAGRATQSALAAQDRHYEEVEDAEHLDRLMTCLDLRERQVLSMRYMDELSQPQIAERVGVSQSYVSRILKRSLAQLHNESAIRV